MEFTQNFSRKWDWTMATIVIEFLFPRIEFKIFRKIYTYDAYT